MLERVVRTFSKVRYRFFLPAGVFPYVLGSAVAYYATAMFDFHVFFAGIFGVAMILVGVEAFNEYFDPADRVFLVDAEPVNLPRTVFWTGTIAFTVALLIGVYLALTRGPLVIILSVIGFFLAAFYVGPPIRLAYRGFGEAGIFLAYGPLMALGSYYIQVLRVDTAPIFASLVPSVLILALAVANEIPDYYQDLLVGKMNIVVRVGRRNGILLYSLMIVLCYALIAFGLMFGILPIFALISLLTLPLAYRSVGTALKHYDNPQRFISTIRDAATMYVIISSILILAYLSRFF
ncbi:MAG: prenyltransferase [Nitrososphaerales archaeon]